MRKIFTVLILSFIPLLAFSQKDFKLVEQSQKEKPEWLTSYNHKEALMIQANRAASLEDAKNSVMTSLLNNIASSVAVQITSKTDVNVDWSVSGENDVYNEDIKTTTTMEIADMPALQGISLSKAETYWEKYHNKKTDETYYDYYILYPFTYQDLENLIEEYNKAKTLDKYPDEWKVFTSHDYIYDIQSEKKDANKSEAELVNNLLDVARANIAKQIQVKVKDNSSINGKTTFATDIDVTLLLTKSHFNPHVNKIYAIAYVNKQEAARFYKRQTDVIFNDVEKHLSVADTYVETGFVAKAKDELKKTAEICCNNNVFIIDDEIHNDLIMPGYEHTVMANVSENAKNNIAVCTAPSKTFNLAGVQCSNIIIPNDEIRAKAVIRNKMNMQMHLNVFAYTICTSA